MKRPEIERIIEHEKGVRRVRIKGVLVVFLAVLFITLAVFMTAGISVGMMYNTARKTASEADGSSDKFQDIRTTLVGGKITKDFLSDEEIKEEEERAKKEAEEKVAAEKAEEEKKQVKGDEGYVAPKGKKVVYLTFDDGPGDDTMRLLDILKKYDVKATFFVTCKGEDAAIKRAYEEGHVIGLHTCTHNYNIYTNLNTYFNDLEKVSARVERITGMKSKLMRFPGGSSNTVSRKYDGGKRIMSKLVSEVGKRGYTYFDWNIASGDADTKAISTDRVYKNVVFKLKGDYSIVLQHDVKGFSVDAVEDIIKFGLKYGFTFKTLDTDSPTAHHRVNN